MSWLLPGSKQQEGLGSHSLPLRLGLLSPQAARAPTGFPQPPFQTRLQCASSGKLFPACPSWGKSSFSVLVPNEQMLSSYYVLETGYHCGQA